MQPASTRENKYFLASCAIFFVFLSYYLWASSTLPERAGPDYRSNNEATAFIFDHHRLAVLPDDEDQIYFTVYGGTRSLRPPLSYLVSAAVANLYHTETDRDRFIAFRKGSSLLTAAAVAVCFYGLFVLFESAWLALFGAALFGLLPQLTFIASYSNDDSGAIFSATLLFSVLSVVYKRGLSPGRLALLGLAAGLVILAKFSAWLVLPFVALYVMAVAVSTLEPKQWLGYGFLAAIMLLIGGGWWMLFNIYHYGTGDPVAWNIQQEMVDKHIRLGAAQGEGYAAQGIGFNELWLDNYKNFLGETFKSTVGNLDWLRLKVGPIQYLLYQLVLGVAVIYYLLRLVGCIAAGIRHRDWSVFDRRLLFESVLFAAVLFQFYMYTWTNISNDIQIQGKYLLPVLMAVLLLFFLALESVGVWFQERMSRIGRKELIVTTHTLSRAALAGGVMAVVLVHVDALVNYVIPYYQPPLYNLKLGQFSSVDLDNLVPESVNNLEVTKRGAEIELRPTGEDPWVIWSEELCVYFKRNTALRLTLEATQSDRFQIFIDEGEGFSEEQSVRLSYDPGTRQALVSLAVAGCKRIRFDPARGPAPPVVLRDIGVSQIDIRPRS